MRLVIVWMAAIGWGLTAAPAAAHHGTAIFDSGKKLTMQVTVVEWHWTNPHCYLEFDVQDEHGLRRWMAEVTSPSRMLTVGWMKTTFKAGDRITVAVEPVKDGRPVGRLLQVTLPGGEVLRAP